jgi:hypothetical protein
VTSVEGVTRASVPPDTTGEGRWRRRSPGFAVLAGLAVSSLLVASCGGDDDDADSSSTTTDAPGASTTTDPPRTTTTAPPTTTTTLAYVTEGAGVIVANASGINGAAGRLTDRLAIVGFTTRAATNASDAVGQLETSQIHYAPDDDKALAVAQSLQAALGGGPELVELTTPAPIADPDSAPRFKVLVLMGNDVADKSLEELQGLAPPADEGTNEETGDTADESSADTAEESSADTADG